MFRRPGRFILTAFGPALLAASVATAQNAPAGDRKADAKPDEKPVAAQPADPNQSPLDLKLPKPAFKGTPKDVPAGTRLEKPRSGPRPPFLAPKGTKNLALRKPVTASDSEPIVGKLTFVTDGDKEATEGSYVELGPGTQWVQIDLGQPAKLYAIVVWHYHSNARVYHDVIVQVADDADFKTNVRTLYNNDHDNSSKLGAGSELEYWETFEGRLVDAKGEQARFVRLYSRGSTADDQNHYTEVEVHGIPVK